MCISEHLSFSDSPLICPLNNLLSVTINCAESQPTTKFSHYYHMENVVIIVIRECHVEYWCLRRHGHLVLATVSELRSWCWSQHNTDTQIWPSCQNISFKTLQKIFQSNPTENILRLFNQENRSQTEVQCDKQYDETDLPQSLKHWKADHNIRMSVQSVGRPEDHNWTFSGSSKVSTYFRHQFVRKY